MRFKHEPPQKSITLQMLYQAYADTGLKPERGTTLNQQSACGLGVLYAAANEYDANDELLFEKVINWNHREFGFPYACSFLAAWDGDTPEGLPSRLGFSDGLAAAAAIFDKSE